MLGRFMVLVLPILLDRSADSCHNLHMAAPENTTTAEHVPPELAAAIELGHAPEWDPPAAMSSVKRWTCPCGAAVLSTAYSVYGSAVAEQCTRGAR
jgi:hypothetical protein